MREYNLLIRNDKIRSYNLFGWFIITINIFFTVYVGLTVDGIPNWPVISFLSLNALILVFQFWFRKSIYKFGLHPYFITGGMFWLLVGFIPVVGLLVVFEILHMIATKKPVVVVSHDHITYPSLINKKTRWEQLNNLILKDGLLTIDFKNNKVIQQTIDENKTPVDEKEFNEFCRNQLRKSRPGQNGPGIGEALEGFGEIISSIN